MNKEEPALAQFRYKTQMMKEIEEINNECFPKAQTEEKDEISNELLTLDEMKERRREIARLKLKESQKIAKKRLQGKIKSKKYHRLRKREELKQKLKDFEELKVSNPEAALKELEKIEKQRIQERANLRHKNTGTWAKNMKVIFKYF
jgi:U3 small nucleolar RNA-associated protein 14